MQHLTLTTATPLATVTLARGKVNAINDDLVNELRSTFHNLAEDPDTRAVILTGSGPFFSFGLDVPDLYDLPPDRFESFLRNFIDLCHTLFIFPKPLVAAINGHAIAGGCILATTCDRRVMLSGKPRIALNELTFGSTIFQTAIEFMRYWIGSRYTEQILLSGRMYSADEAHTLGLIDTVVPSVSGLLPTASDLATGLIRPNPESFAHVKSMLRRPIHDRIRSLEEPTIKRFVEIWYSSPVRALLRSVTIR